MEQTDFKITQNITVGLVITSLSRITKTADQPFPFQLSSYSLSNISLNILIIIVSDWTVPSGFKNLQNILVPMT